ncbi:hypothetical protein [Streptomyces yanii]|uniref:Uncharacterized protein n=1 Tax=Streptomyces yanii TaxID=78510 RepID=A0ABV5RET7_9ACTN
MSQQYPFNPNQPQQPQQGQPQYQGQQPYPGQPQQPYYGAPAGYPGGPIPPQQKKSWFARHKVLTAVGGVFAFLVIVGIAAGGGDDSTSKTSDTAASTPAKTDAKPAEKTDDKPTAPAKKKEAPAPKKELSQAEQFKAFIDKNGTAAEKAAAKHITKVQGADETNDIMDTADVYTDFTGGMMGPHQGEGKLLASAFADWKSSKNGLVTIYDKAGEILSNGNY